MRLLPGVLALLLCPTVPAQDRLVVEVEGGLIRGEALRVGEQEVRAFRGIPFAAPPVAELRWRAPQPVEPWQEVRACTALAPACPQPADLAYGMAFKRQSEDCLYLNVWTAARDDAERRPVMVWIHGGGNVIGGAGSPLYDGRHFAAAGVVLVSIQYRLGAFGYLAHPALTAEAKEKDGRAASGNYGLLDQIAALRWVQANITRFGGDKDRVTIFGESAGAANVTYLMASPLARGLFHRAIAQSGYFGANTPRLIEDTETRARAAHDTGRDFARRLGIDGDDAEALAALRALPPDRLLSVPMSIGSLVSAGSGRALRLGPVVDGFVLPRPPQEVWEKGEMHHVPFIAGSLLDDGSVFSRANPVRRVAGYRLAARAIFGEDSERALALFPVTEDEEVPDAVHRITTLLAFRAPARRLVRWVEAAGGEAWLYHFSRNPRRGRPGRGGVVHGLEIGYVFQTLSGLGNATDKALAADMMRRWISFARDGNPDGKDDKGPEPAWPRYEKATDRHLELGDEVRVGEGLDRAACDLLDEVASRRRR